MGLSELIEDLKQMCDKLIKSFLEEKNMLWFLFGVWIGFVIIAICHLLGIGGI